jgi:thymidylate synthase ThyX
VAFTPSARIIADSISSAGDRLTTIEARMHRFVLAEFNTHRTLSRSSASSRAIPVRRIFQQVADEPAVPLSWPAEQRGMQGGDELPKLKQATATQTWLAARDEAVNAAEKLVELGVHKSVVNRLLEPFLPHTVIASATDWTGFFAQRCSPLAQPEIRAVADAMKAAYDASEPVGRHEGSWHLPYVTAQERIALGKEKARKVSAARCARVSYLTHDGRRDFQADLDLYHRLVTASPPHWSPLEHVATPYTGPGRPKGNFVGWLQLRHFRG